MLLPRLRWGLRCSDAGALASASGSDQGSAGARLLSRFIGCLPGVLIGSAAQRLRRPSGNCVKQALGLYSSSPVSTVKNGLRVENYRNSAQPAPSARNGNLGFGFTAE